MEVVKDKAIKAVHTLNDYFFDVEPGDDTDWFSALLFYGVCGLAVAVTLLTVAAWLFE